VLNLETSYGYDFSTLRRYVLLLRSGTLSKAEAESLLRDCRELAAKCNIALGKYNSKYFGKRVLTRHASERN
jgi:hypothetical protein